MEPKESLFDKLYSGISTEIKELKKDLAQRRTKRQFSSAMDSLEVESLRLEDEYNQLLSELVQGKDVLLKLATNKIQRKELEETRVTLQEIEKELF